MERLLVVMGPKMIKVWYLGGPKGQNLEKPKVFEGFKGSRGSQGGSPGTPGSDDPGGLASFLRPRGGLQGGKQTIRYQV